jgi:hypothetical protein
MPRSKSHDPNNRAPEVTPADQWGDATDVPDREVPVLSILPARRKMGSRPHETIHAEAGLRIEPKLSQVPSGDPTLRLEVQEVNREVIRLEQEVKSTFKLDRQPKLQERIEPAESGGDPKDAASQKRVIQQLPKSWIFGMIATVALLVIVGLLLLPLINSTNAPSIHSNPTVLGIVEEEEIEGSEAMDRLLEKQPEALQIFRSYAQAVHHDEVVPLVVDGRSLLDALKNKWSPLGVPKDWAPDADSSWGVMEAGGKAYGLLEGVLPDQSPFRAYFTHEGGRLLLDWKATTAFGTTSFRQLSKGTGDAGEIRGILSSDEFYSAVFPEADYQSYRLTMPDEEFTIWCYAQRGSLAYSALAPLFTSGELSGERQTDRKVTLSLVRGPEETLPNQWIIRELLHIDWGTH